MMEASEPILHKKSFQELTLDELRRFSPAFSEDVYEAIAPETCVQARNIPGGPAPSQVLAAIEAGERLLELVRSEE